MKKYLSMVLGLFAVVLFGLGSIGCNKVPAGNVGVKVYLTGSSKGVDHEVLSPGRYWIGFNEDLFLFPTFQKTHNWTKTATEGNAQDESFTFQDKQGMSINADIGVSFYFDKQQISTLFQKFRKGEDEITDVYLRSVVRDALNRQSSMREVEAIYGPGKAQFMLDVTEDVKKQVAPYGIMVDKLMLINELRLPPQIVSALNAKVEATQTAMRIENEKRAAEAMAVKQVAEAEGHAKSRLINAKAEAEANRIVAASISPTLIEWEKAKAFRERWNGGLPTVQGGNSPLINLDLTKK